MHPMILLLRALPAQLFVALAVLLTGLSTAQAQVPSQALTFARGATGAEIQGTIRGRETMKYALSVTAGQRISVRLYSNRPATYFDVLAPGGTSPVHDGSNAGVQFDATAQASGDYTLLVYQTGSAATSYLSTSYTLSVTVTNPSNPQPPPQPPPSGNATWEVYNLAGFDTLNIRSGPDTTYQVVVRVAPGTILRDLGCQTSGATRWCRVETTGPGAVVTGWASAAYLRRPATTPTPPAPTPQPPPPPPNPGTGSTYFQVVGTNSLNVRSGPGVVFPVVGTLINGSVVRGGSCQTVFVTDWCQVTSTNGVSGWASADFLRQTSAPAPQPPAPPASGEVPNVALNACLSQADSYYRMSNGSSRAISAVRSGSNWVVTTTSGPFRADCTVTNFGQILAFSPMF